MLEALNTKATEFPRTTQTSSSNGLGAAGKIPQFPPDKKNLVLELSRKPNCVRPVSTILCAF